MTSSMALVKIILLVFIYGVLLNTFVSGRGEPRKENTSLKEQRTTQPKNTFALELDDNCKDIYGRCTEKLCYWRKTSHWKRRMRKICRNTCGFCRARSPPACVNSEYGCCWDYITAAIGPGGKGCPPCEDNPRYPNVCHRFRTYCRKRKISGNWMRLNCPDACGHCAIWQFK